MVVLFFMCLWVCSLWHTCQQLGGPVLPHMLDAGKYPWQISCFRVGPPVCGFPDSRHWMQQTNWVSLKKLHLGESQSILAFMCASWRRVRLSPLPAPATGGCSWKASPTLHQPTHVLVVVAGRPGPHPSFHPHVNCQVLLPGPVYPTPPANTCNGGCSWQLVPLTSSDWHLNCEVLLPGPAWPTPSPSSHQCSLISLFAVIHNATSCAVLLLSL